VGPGPQKLVFVGGAPRSGTTVTHALLCTVPGAGPHHPEISFFRGFMQAYRNGKTAWKGHTSAYFRDPSDFRALIRETADLALGQVWRTLGEPAILCAKDPHLTPFFPDLRELYPTEACFVTVARDPRAVVRSRQAVHEKSGAPRPFGPGDVAAVCREYVGYYRAVLQADFGGSHALIRYEDLDRPDVHTRLAELLGVGSLDTNRLWSGSRPRPERDVWGTPKHLGPLDLEPRLEPLEPSWAGIVADHCGPLMARLGYGEAT